MSLLGTLEVVLRIDINGCQLGEPVGEAMRKLRDPFYVGAAGRPVMGLERSWLIWEELAEAFDVAKCLRLPFDYP